MHNQSCRKSVLCIYTEQDTFKQLQHTLNEGMQLTISCQEQPSLAPPHPSLEASRFPDPWHIYV